MKRVLLAIVLLLIMPSIVLAKGNENFSASWGERTGYLEKGVEYRIKLVDMKEKVYFDCKGESHKFTLEISELDKIEVVAKNIPDVMKIETSSFVLH